MRTVRRATSCSPSIALLPSCRARLAVQARLTGHHSRPPRTAAGGRRGMRDDRRHRAVRRLFVAVCAGRRLRRRTRSRTGRTGRSRSWCRSAPAAPPTGSAGSPPIICRRPSSSSSTSRTGSAPAARWPRRTVARADADGYTLLIGGSGPHIMGPAENPNIGYDPVGDFTHIAMIGGESYALSAQASLGVKSFKELIALSKSKAEPINCGSPGAGSLGQLMVETDAAAGRSPTSITCPIAAARRCSRISSAITFRWRRRRSCRSSSRRRPARSCRSR